MVETERSHRSGSRRSTGTTKTEFFLCFSSRSSSSSMKISSKSILSPGRSREPNNLSLSSSLSRRLRSNGSMKGGQASPMFPTGVGKKKGGGFEPPEPSSPKVTCIGQVRVKSKKKYGRKKLRTRSGRRGEVSFRKTEQAQQQPQQQQECLGHRNQRWVHLPLSICETLRNFGADFNCFGPCGGRGGSSCSWTSSEREKVEKRRGSSCGAVFARWLFALQESEEKGGKEIESVSVREEEKIKSREVVREIEMQIEEEKLEMKKEEIVEEEIEEGRESICIPPKNALLLMRSRSAPFRMSSLANRFWDSPSHQESKEEVEVAEEEEEEEVEVETEESEEIVVEEALEQEKEGEIEVNLVLEEEEEENKEEEMPQMEQEEEESPENVEEDHLNEEVMVNESSVEFLKDEEKFEDQEEPKMQVEEEVEVKEVMEKKEERRVSFSSSTMYLEPEPEPEPETDSEQENEATLEEEKEISVGSSTDQDGDNDEVQDDEEEKALLPECLLLMMCEPKLSMEVSKETWVCSTDFISFRHSEKKLTKKNNESEFTTKKRLSTDSNHPSEPQQKQQQQQHKQKQKQSKPPIQVQPARSSCSKVEPSVARVIEQKLANAGGGVYEPFVLKRCKSEPRRNSAKLVPEVCFWNNNKKLVEPHHRPPSLGVGAAGIGC